MTTRMDFDLADAYNRIVDMWYPVFTPTRPLSMPIAACAYPINMGEHMIASIRDDVLPEDYHLRWQMAMPTGGAGKTGEYHLYCNWQGRAWQHDEDHYVFIENAVGWVDWLGTDDVGQLDVHVAFGRPYFANGVASMAVDFMVTETDVDGVRLREVHRPFQIHADGRRQPIF
ncbi:MAG: hypothetical protein ABI862_00210 [Ilumatobacteraceae bacterium]